MKQKPAISTVEQLMQLDPAPCKQALEWLAENNITDLADAWDRCHRADWMLWLSNALSLLDDHELRLIACRCVRETPLSDGGKVWDLLTDEIRRAVAIAERYVVGKATDEQLAAASSATAYAAAAAAARTHAAYAAAADAAWAATAVAAYAAATTAAYAAATTAARAAQSAAAAETDADALDAARAAQADLVREIVGNPWRDSAAQEEERQ